jgi:hypothetical protein
VLKVIDAPRFKIIDRTGAFSTASAKSLRNRRFRSNYVGHAQMHEVREFAGHAEIRTTEVYFVRKEEDAEVAARRIQIRLTGRKSE